MKTLEQLRSDATPIARFAWFAIQQLVGIDQSDVTTAERNIIVEAFRELRELGYHITWGFDKYDQLRVVNDNPDSRKELVS